MTEHGALEIRLHLLTTELGIAKVAAMRDPVIDKVIQKFGGTSRLARDLGIRAPSIYSWKRVPAQHVHRISELTGFAPHELRPDLWAMSESAAARGEAA